MVQVVSTVLARLQREQRRKEEEESLPEAQRHAEKQGRGSLPSEAIKAPEGADGEKSVVLWLLDNESIERQPKQPLGSTQVADMFAT